MSTAPKLQKKTDLSDVLSEAVRNKAQVKPQQKAVAEVDPFPNIEANPFHVIMFNPSMTPEQKKAEVANALTFTGTREEMRARIKEFETFKEWLQHEREEMAKEIIELTDTETFSNLQRVYDDFNTELNKFNEKMAPLTDIIDAIYTLRTNGATFDAFQKIQEDRAYEATYEQTKQQKVAERSGIDAQIQNLKSDIAALGQQKGFFGFGAIKEEARQEIARKEEAIAQARERAAALENEVTSLEQEAQARRGQEGEFYAERQKLRQLLDLTGPEHIERQKDLVNAAMSFVTKSKDRIGEVRQHLGHMQEQVEGLFDANNKMVRVYSVLDEALKEAEAKNHDVRAKAMPPTNPESEDKIAQMKREETKMAVEDFIAALTDAAADTVATHSDLSSQTIRIRTMRDANQQQSNMARKMHSQGIAGVADRLSVVLQAVNSAALGESSSMAKDTLIRMAENTNKVAQKESIRLAMGQTEINKDLERALEDLAQYGEVQRTATDISRTAVQEMRQKLDELQKLARDVQKDTQEAIAVHADVGQGSATARETKKEASGRGAFRFGGV